MKRVLRWVLGVFLCLLLLGLALVLLRDRIFKSIAENRIQTETGLKADIGYLRTGLGSGTVAAREIKVFNPADFGSSLLLNVRELYVELDAEHTTAR